MNLSKVRQPLRALMYAHLVWKHLLTTPTDDVLKSSPADTHVFTYHQNGNIRTILGVVGFLVIVEGIAIDFFVATKSTKLAILLGVLHLMMLLYAVALMRATKQRPILVIPTGLLIRTSLLYCCWVPVQSLQSITLLEKEIERINAPSVLWCALGDQPNVAIELAQKEVAILPFGMIKLPTSIYIFVDKPSALVDALSQYRL